MLKNFISENFNGERTLIALGAVVLIIGGTFLGSPKRNVLLGINDTTTKKSVETIGYSILLMGWIIFGISIIYIHSQSVRGIVEIMSGKVVVAIVSVFVIAIGSMLMSEIDVDISLTESKQEKLEESHSEKNKRKIEKLKKQLQQQESAEIVPIVLTIVGWIGMVGTLLFSGSSGNMYSWEKISMVVVSSLLVGLGLAAEHKFNRSTTSELKLALSNAQESDDDNALSSLISEIDLVEKAPRAWPLILNGIGMSFMALAVGYYN